MASSTALQLVNRVRIKRRWPAVSSFEANDIQTTTILMLLNESIRDLVDSDEWGFELIRDGILVTRKSFAVEDVALVRDSTAISTMTTSQDVAGVYTRAALTDGAAGDDVAQGAEQWRMILTDSEYPNTSWPITGLYNVGDGLTPITYVATLRTAWPGATASRSGEIVAYEYMISQSHYRIISARHEETPIEVLIGDASDYGNDRRFLRPWETKGHPEVMFVGGAAQTNFSVSSNDSIGLKVSLWPAPDLDENTTAATYAPRGPVIHYAYRDESAELSATTDTVSFTTDKAVPRVVEDLVVDLAIAKGLQGPLEADYDAGFQMERTVRARSLRIRKNLMPAQGARNILRPLDRTSTRGDSSWGFGRLPRIIEGE